MASRRPQGGGSDADDPSGDEPRPDPTSPVDDQRSDAAQTKNAAANPETQDGSQEGQAAGEPTEHTERTGGDDLDESVEQPDADATGDPAPVARPSRRSVLDARTLCICALIALLAAVAAGLVTSLVTDDGDAEAAPEATLTPSQEAPDIPLTRFDGSETSLADYRGQALVVNFWSTTCQPCVQEMPDLEAVHTSLGEDVAFLGVNTRDSPEAAQALAERTGVTYDLVRDVDGRLSRALKVTTLPVTMLVAPDGTVMDTIRRRVSSERLCEKINQSLLGGSLEECG